MEKCVKGRQAKGVTNGGELHTQKRQTWKYMEGGIHRKRVQSGGNNYENDRHMPGDYR